MQLILGRERLHKRCRLSMRRQWGRGRFRGLGAQPLRKLRHGGGGLDAELVAQERRVHRRVLDGGGRVARRGQRLHQSKCDARAEPVVRREPSPPAHSIGDRTTVLGSLRQTIEHLGVRSSESLAFAIEPSLELRSIDEEHPVE